MVIPGLGPCAALLRCCAAWLCAGALLPAAAREPEPVSLASLDRPAGQALRLTGLWFAAGPARAPAVVLLHGCGGPHDRHGRLSERLRDYAALLNQAGLHALVLDSFTARGERQICTQRHGARTLTQEQRLRDALGALQWLAQRPEVDAARLGLLGWSNGGSTVLAATNLRREAVAAAAPRPAFALAFYPGCATELRRGYEASAPLLMLVGEADDWTPAAPCHRLAESARGPRPRIHGFEGAYHGFDSAAPLRVRRDVSNGTRPGQGVTVGGNAQAWVRSRERLLEFLAEQLR